MTTAAGPAGTTGRAGPAARTSARAVVVDRPREHRIVSGPQPLPGPGEVRVAVHAAGIRAADLGVYEGSGHAAGMRYPVMPGSEWAGTVDAVGEGVDPALAGRKTVAESFRACLSCERCREGATQLCTGGYEEADFTRPGAFADRLVLPARLLHPLPDGADLRSAALLEPAAVAAAAALAGAPRPGERVAVVGAGTLGLLAVQLLAAWSPAVLLAVEPGSAGGELALRLGADRTCTPEEAAAEQGRYDLVLETAGADSSAHDACLLARPGGRAVLAGAFLPGALGPDPLHLVRSGITVGSVSGASSAAWSFAVRAFTSGLLDPAPLITHEFPLAAFGEAMAVAGGAEGPDTGKVLLRP